MHGATLARTQRRTTRGSAGGAHRTLRARPLENWLSRNRTTGRGTRSTAGTWTLRDRSLRRRTNGRGVHGTRSGLRHDEATRRHLRHGLGRMLMFRRSRWSSGSRSLRRRSFRCGGLGDWFGFHRRSWSLRNHDAWRLTRLRRNESRSGSRGSGRQFFCGLSLSFYPLNGLFDGRANRGCGNRRGRCRWRL